MNANANSKEMRSHSISSGLIRSSVASEEKKGIVNAL